GEEGGRPRQRQPERRGAEERHAEQAGEEERERQLTHEAQIRGHDEIISKETFSVSARLYKSSGVRGGEPRLQQGAAIRGRSFAFYRRQRAGIRGQKEGRRARAPRLIFRHGRR